MTGVLSIVLLLCACCMPVAHHRQLTRAEYTLCTVKTGPLLSPRDAMDSRDYAVARYLSVCPSVSCRYSVEMTRHILQLFSPLGSHAILVFSHQTVWQYSDGEPPNEDVECKGDVKKS